MNASRLDIERIVQGLPLQCVAGPTPRGPNAVVADSTPSTNTEIWERVGDANAHGFVLLAEHQTAGRGRLGRVWHAPRGASLLLSVLLIDPHDPARERQAALGGQLGLIAAVACFDAMADALGAHVELKWPNDLLAGGKKIGGILVESRVLDPNGAASSGRVGYVAGIGINCLQHRGHFPPELRNRATSLDLECAGPIDRNVLARALLRQLDQWLASFPAINAPAVRMAWLERAVPLGRRIRLQHSGKVYSGNIVDLDPTAGLVVQLDEGGRRMFDAARTTILLD